MRRRLQAGAGRRGITLLLVVLCFAVVIPAWGWLRAHGVNLLDGLQKVAFVAAAFAVTAYNLRVRVVDLVLKLEVSPAAIVNIATTARNCGKKLTDLVLLFTLAAVVMGSAGFIPADSTPAPLAAALAASLLTVSLAQFVYILFAFERLERFMLDDAEERARDREAKRLAAASEDDDQAGGPPA